MSANYSEYLAVQVINEGAAVNYRLLGRAMKVHCNVAKQMLYDFHTKQTSKRPGSVHATYLIHGQRRSVDHVKFKVNGSSANAKEAEDSIMAEQPPSSSAANPEADNVPVPTPVTSLTLVGEENLESVKTAYETIDSTHIYSLEPGRIKDLQILSECNRKVAKDYAAEDPLHSWRQYGVIQNPQVQRRTGVRPPPVAAPVAAPRAATQAKEDSKSQPASKPAARPPTLKKESSSILASFAKGASQKTAKAEDEPMHDAPDEGDDDNEAFAASHNKDAKEKAEANRRAKQEREDKLRKMMDEEDGDNDEEPEAMDVDLDDSQALDGPTTTTTAPHVTSTDPIPDGDAKPDSAPASQTSTGTPAEAQKSDGRRRGRRRVMKKKTTQDAEGYLITKEEAVWESFSEDETESTVKSTSNSISASSAGIKSSANAAGGAKKKGQGNIMSFFAKK